MAEQFHNLFTYPRRCCCCQKLFMLCNGGINISFDGEIEPGSKLDGSQHPYWIFDKADLWIADNAQPFFF